MSDTGDTWERVRVGSAGAAWLVAACCAATFGATRPAAAQAGGGFAPLPPTVVNTRVGDLRAQLEQYLPGIKPRAVGPAFIVSSGIGVDIGVTDNARQVERPREADVFTLISPTINVSGETSRLQLNLGYAPVVSVYANTSSQNRVDQYGNASVLATIVPETVFVDLRGNVSQQSRSGGFNQSQNQEQSLNRDDQVQSASFSVTPYAKARFQGWGTGRISYSYARTVQDGRRDQNDFNRFGTNQNFNNGFNTNGFNNNFFGTTGNVTTQRQRGSFVTGENLGRINNITVLEAVQYSGGATYRGAYRNQFSNDVGYAITRTITAIAGVGYQDIRFPGTPGIRINEPTWRFGGRITPNADSSITVTYGRKDGFNGAAADGSYSPTARTRVFVRYSTGLTTDAEEQQNVLETTSIGPGGLLTDSTTGAPVSSGGGSFGTQNGLFQLRRFSATGLLILNRDSVSVSISNEERTNVSNTTGFNGQTVPAGASSNGTTGSVAWQHEFSPALTGSASASYTISDNSNVAVGTSGGNSQRTIQTTLGLGYTFTRTLSGSARYLFTDRTGGVGRGQSQNGFNQFGFGQSGQNLTSNTLLVGLRKSF